MAEGFYNDFKKDVLVKNIDLSSDTIKCALLSSTHSFDADNSAWADISANEVSGTGYTAGGTTVSGSTVTVDDTNDRASWDAENPAWSGSTITARYAVLYDTTVSNRLICCFDFGEEKSSNSGTFTIQFNANGIALFS